MLALDKFLINQGLTVLHHDQVTGNIRFQMEENPDFVLLYDVYLGFLEQLSDPGKMMAKRLRYEVDIKKWVSKGRKEDQKPEHVDKVKIYPKFSTFKRYFYYSTSCEIQTQCKMLLQ